MPSFGPIELLRTMGPTEDIMNMNSDIRTDDPVLIRCAALQYSVGWVYNSKAREAACVTQTVR